MEFLVLPLFIAVIFGKFTIMLGKNKKYKYVKYLIPLSFLILMIVEYNNYLIEIKESCYNFGCLGQELVPLFLVWFCAGQFVFTLGACIITSIKYNDVKDEKSNNKFTTIHIILVNILIYWLIAGPLVGILMWIFGE